MTRTVCDNCLGILEMGALTLATRGARLCAWRSQASWMHTSSLRTHKGRGEKWYWYTVTEKGGRWSISKSQQPSPGQRRIGNRVQEEVNCGVWWEGRMSPTLPDRLWIRTTSPQEQPGQVRLPPLALRLLLGWGFRAAASSAPLVGHPGEVDCYLLMLEAH